MPRIPTYTSQLGIPGGVTNYSINERTFMPAVRGTQQLGNILKKRGEQLLQEHDTAMALGAYNRLRDQSRTKLEEFSKLEGADAVNLQPKYNEWYNKTLDNIAKNDLTVSRQQDLFKELSDRRRQTDLDSIAAHEAQQLSVLKQEQSQELENTISRDIVNIPIFDHKQHKAQVDGMLNDYFQSLDGLYQGHNLKAKKIVALKKIHTEIAEDLIARDPSYARTWIKRHKKDLGDNYPVLQKKMEYQEKKDGIDAAYIALKEQFPDDPDGALTYLRKAKNQKDLGINVEQKQYLARVFSSESAQMKRIKKDVKIEGQLNEVNGISAKIREGDIPGAMALIDSAVYIDESQKLKLENQLKKGDKNSDKGPYETTDPVVYGRISKILSLTPEKVNDRSEIWDLHGKGLSTKDCEVLEKKWITAIGGDIKGPNLQSRYTKLLKEFETAGLYSEDPRENTLEYGRLQLKMDDYFHNNPNPDPQKTQDFFANLTKETEDDFWSRAFETFSNFIDAGTGGGTTRAIDRGGVYNPYDETPWVKAIFGDKTDNTPAEPVKPDKTKTQKPNEPAPTEEKKLSKFELLKKKRERAIKILEENGKVVTEGNIVYVMKQL